MSLALIWAEARDGIIGADGGIPWHIPEDLAHFRELTTGSAVLMGRRTWDSLPERFRPLPGRRNLVLTRDVGWSSTGADVIQSLSERPMDASLWCIGGGELYAQCLPLADRVEVTEVDLTVAGDTRAPELGPGWARTSESPWLTSRTGTRYRFVSHARA